MAARADKVPILRTPAGEEPQTQSAPRPNSIVTQSLASVTTEVRERMVAEAAYYIAEHRGFEPGQEVQDWRLAEIQIDAALASGKPAVAAG